MQPRVCGGCSLSLWVCFQVVGRHEFGTEFYLESLHQLQERRQSCGMGNGENGMKYSLLLLGELSEELEGKGLD